jgi:hypothetical protein
MSRYLYSVACAMSVLINALTGGQAPETFSYRSAKARRAGKRWGCLLCRLLDTIDRDHCARTIHAWEK